MIKLIYRCILLFSCRDCRNSAIPLRVYCHFAFSLLYPNTRIIPPQELKVCLGGGCGRSEEWEVVVERAVELSYQ